MRKVLILAILGLFASGCVGLVQIGKGPLQVGQPKATPTPDCSKGCMVPTGAEK